MRFGKAFFVLLTLTFVLAGCSVQNLHILDRIPHEVQDKGYVQFQSEVSIGGESAQSNEGIKSLIHSILKMEYGNEIPIIGIPVTFTTKPITDRAGNQVYVIRYPKEVAVYAPGVSAYDQVEYLDAFGKGVDLGSPTVIKPPTPKVKVKWTTAEKEIEIPVNEGMLTFIKLDLALHTDDDAGDKFTGTLSYKVENPMPYPHKSNLINPGATGPRTYDQQYDQVFSGVMQGTQELGWSLEDKDQDSGKIAVKISRFPGEPFFFTITVHPTMDGKMQVDVSSDSVWQKWGSINTELSVEKITQFYETLDHILALNN
jgi:hypothetical protein